MKKSVVIFLGLMCVLTNLYASSGPYKFTKTKAFCYFQQGDYERAIHLYEKILLTNKGDVDVYYNLGCLYVEVGQYEMSIKAFERVVMSMSPLAKDAIYNLSVLYGKHLNDKKKAMKYYTRYKRIVKSMEQSNVGS